MLFSDGYTTELMIRDMNNVEKYRSDIDFLNFLCQVIPPDEMEKYREMYKCTNDKNNC